MINIAVLSGDKKSINHIKSCLSQFVGELKEICKISTYDNLLAFFGDYKSGFDILIIDTYVSDVTGVQVAKMIRENNDKIPVIFISDSPADAIYGFTYNAVAYLLKPLNAKQLYSAWNLALNNLAEREPDQIQVKDNGVLLAVDIKKLRKVTVEGHYLHYYSDIGKYTCRGTMKDCESRLLSYGFVRCNHNVLVNMRYVTSVANNNLILDGERISISYKKAKLVRDKFKNK